MKKVWLIAFALLLMTTVCAVAEELYFNNPKLVSFFAAFNEIADVPVANEDVSRGNIRGKYYISRENVEWTMYAYLDRNSSVPGVLIDYSAEAKNDLEMYEYFRNIVLALRPGITEEEIKKAWEYAKEVAEMDILDQLALDDEWGEYPTEIDQLAVSYFSLKKRDRGTYSYRIKIHDCVYLIDEEKIEWGEYR